jgi:hypothetical protein
MGGDPMKKARRETIMFIGFMLFVFGLGQLIGVFFPANRSGFLAKYGGDTDSSKPSSEDRANIQKFFLFTTFALTIPGIALIVISWPKHKH